MLTSGPPAADRMSGAQRSDAVEPPGGLSIRTRPGFAAPTPVDEEISQGVDGMVVDAVLEG